MKSVALITGANKGIGYQIALGLCKKGCKVMLGCREEKNGQTAVASLKDLGFDTSAILLDVTEPSSLARAAAQIDKQHGRLDILVNNAGIAAGRGDTARDASLNVVKQIYETNVFGVISTIQAMIPLLLRSSQGRIVNLSSSVGSLTLSSDPACAWSKHVLLGYNSSKTALNGLTVQFANELRDTKIRVNSVCPGYVKTDLNNHQGLRSPEDGARIAIELATNLEDGPTGGFFNDGGSVPW